MNDHLSFGTVNRQPDFAPRHQPKQHPFQQLKTNEHSTSLELPTFENQLLTEPHMDSQGVEQAAHNGFSCGSIKTKENAPTQEISQASFFSKNSSSNSIHCSTSECLEISKNQFINENSLNRNYYHFPKDDEQSNWKAWEFLSESDFRNNSQSWDSVSSTKSDFDSKQTVPEREKADFLVQHGSKFLPADLKATQSTGTVSEGVVKNVVRRRHRLPPCRVCGDMASGFHYGANTCEACKVSQRYWSYNLHFKLIISDHS